MEHHCEVCENLPRSVDRDRPVVQVEFDKRTIVLCRGHARIAANSGITDFDGLRALYGSGRRSHVPRRNLEVLSAGGERQNLGRRAGDRG